MTADDDRTASDEERTELERAHDLDETSSDAVEERRPLAPVQVYEVVSRTGLEELKRPVASLFWSGLAAGLAIGFSVIGRAALESRLPADAAWTPLVGSIGYALGFVMVVLGRFQLFTEQTVTPVMPICHAPSARSLTALARLWGVVLGSNLLGAAVFAAFLVSSGALTETLLEGVETLARHELSKSFVETLAGAVGAGFLIAILVWLLANLRHGEMPVIFAVTWLIGAAGFAHVVAGSVEMFVLTLRGEAGLFEVAGGFILPALIGNVIGGTVLFTLIAYGQVVRELD
ncbi:MAG TPA: formate/nitrite transporter family protein [Paracoccaceae bacterium]|nr:formate/nitrite transporter family protein [Paracoccaceae bacterium]